MENIKLGLALNGRKLSTFEQKLTNVLRDPIFKIQEGLTTKEQAELSYKRLYYLREKLDLRIEYLMNNLNDLLALHYWTSIVDGTLTTLLSIHYNLCIGSIENLSYNKNFLKSELDELEKMDSIGVFLATELGYGNNVQALLTEAVYDSNTKEFILNTPCKEAQKFMPNTGADNIAKIAVVMAQLIVDNKKCGIYPFIVRLRTKDNLMPGIKVIPLGEKPGYALDNAITCFDNVRIPFYYWLSSDHSQIKNGKFSSSIPSKGKRFMNSIDRVQLGKLCLSTAGMSAAQTSLYLTLDYARQRKTFAPGKKEVSILDYNQYQKTTMEGLASLYVCSHFLDNVVEKCTNRKNTIEENRLMALAKILCSYEAREIFSQCREKLGAQGLFSYNRIINYWIQINGIITAEGDNEILLAKSARELLYGIEYEAPNITKIPKKSLDSEEYLIYLLKWQEKSMRDSILKNIIPRMSELMLDVWNDNIVQSMELVKLHAWRIAAESCLKSNVDNFSKKFIRLQLLKIASQYKTDLLIANILSANDIVNLENKRKELYSNLSKNTDFILNSSCIPEDLIDAPVMGNYIEYFCKFYQKNN